MKKLTMKSRDVIGGNVEKIAELFPHCVTERRNKAGQLERAIDWAKLQAELDPDLILEGEERYQFTWPEKRAFARLANEPTTSTLRPCREESVDFDTTENLYIEGDNLDVLKVLRETYLGKVKMIYIDPPYNTGNDFIYHDDFDVAREVEESRNDLFDENGMQTLSRFERNTAANGRFHTDWLNMMYPRLKVARDLLTEDGVIFISIDDNEVNNLRKVCDEIFGRGNFFCQVVVQHNKRGQTYKQISKTHEYLLIYTKSSISEFNELEKDLDNSDLNLIDAISPYNVRELRNRNPKFGKHNRPNLFFPIFVNIQALDKDNFCSISLEKNGNFCEEVWPYNSSGIESCWRWGKALCLRNISTDTQVSNLVARRRQDGKYNIYEKYRKTTYKPKSIWTETEVITEKGTVELGQLEMSAYFDFPKPIGLLRKCLQIGTEPEDIILDFFSGSATTAHAVMQLNAEDGGRRKFIMVQLSDPTDEKSEARKAGYQNICEIGKERIRRAGKKIREEAGENAKGLDTGFRVLKLASSNMAEVFYTPEQVEADMLDGFADNIKPDRTGEDLLFQVMLELGIALSAKIVCREVAGKTVYSVDEDYLLACFDADVNETTIEEMAKRQPVHLVIRDASAASDSVLDNFSQIIASYANEKPITTHIL